MQKGSALPLILAGALIIVGVILFVPLPSYYSGPCLMIVGGKCPQGWYFGDSLWNKLRIQRSTNQFSSSVSPSRDVIQKTYNNKQLDFQFAYSSKDFTVKEDSEEEFNKRGNGVFRKNFKGYVAYEPGRFLGAVVVLGKDGNYDTNPFNLWIFDNPNNLTIDEWYKNYWYYPFIWGDYTLRRNDVAPTDEATISGQIAKSGIIDYQPGKPKFVYISYGKKMYLFRIIGEPGDQILSTFKFI